MKALILLLLFPMCSYSGESYIVEDLEKEGQVQALKLNYDKKFAISGGTVTGKTTYSDNVNFTTATFDDSVAFSGPATFSEQVTINSSIKFSDGTEQDEAFAVFESTALALVHTSLATIPHGLGSTPRFLSFFIKNLTDECGYVTGDLVSVSNGVSSSANDSLGVSVYPDATNLNVRFGANATQIYIVPNKSTGIGCNATHANWELYIKAIR